MRSNRYVFLLPLEVSFSAFLEKAKSKVEEQTAKLWESIATYPSSTGVK